MSTSDIIGGNCSLCGAPIEEIARVGHARLLDRGSLFWFSGRCIVCDIDFTFYLQHGRGEWRLNAPSVADLQAVMEQSEVEQLTRKLERYKIRGAKWQALLNRCRPQDELWRYVSADGSTGVAVVRNGQPVHGFWTL